MLKTTLIILACLYPLIMAAGYFGQRRLLYFPDPTRVDPVQAGLRAVEERVISTPDGNKIIVWHGKPKPGQPTILIFHGNGGSLAGRAAMIAKHIERGRGVLMMSYRGYSGSTGLPTEAANVADAKLAYDMLIQDGVKPDDIILYGESLGTGVAVQVARSRETGGIILDSPFTSVVDRAAEIYPWLPVRLLMQDRYDSSLHIREVRIPLLIVHGEADAVVPVAMGRRLFAVANEPKQIVTFPGAGHNDHDQFGSFDATDSWIEKLRSRPVKP